MILGPHHWFHETTDLQRLLPPEIWMIVFSHVFQNQKIDLQRRYMRENHKSEDEILDPHEYENMMTIIHNQHVVMTHFRRIITHNLRDLSTERFFHTLAKITMMHDRIQNEKNEVVVNWWKHRMRLYTKDLFITHIISYTCVFKIVENKYDLVSAYLDCVWSDQRGEHHKVY